jgi:hypothetical protein
MVGYEDLEWRLESANTLRMPVKKPQSGLRSGVAIRLPLSRASSLRAMTSLQGNCGTMMFENLLAVTSACQPANDIMLLSSQVSTWLLAVSVAICYLLGVKQNFIHFEDGFQYRTLRNRGP